MGVLYVLDEPSIGLHQRDNDRLLKTLIKLRDLGNTVIVVEHDEKTILSADHVLDIGLGAGIHGGEGARVREEGVESPRIPVPQVSRLDAENQRQDGRIPCQSEGGGVYLLEVNRSLWWP